MSKARGWQQADAVLTRLGRAGAGLRAAEHAARSYPAGVPPPYQPAAAELHRLVAEAHAAYAALAGQARALRRQPESPAGRLDDLYRGWQAGRQARTLLAELQALEQTLERAQQVTSELLARPLTVAARAAELRRVADQAGQTVAELHTAGLQGPDLERADGQVRQLMSDLARLPAWLFETESGPILQQAGRQETIDAWQALEAIAPPLGEQAAHLGHWQRQWRDVDRLRADLPGILAWAATAVTDLTAEVDASADAVTSAVVDASVEIDTTPLQAELHATLAASNQAAAAVRELAIDGLDQAATQMAAVANRAQALVVSAHEVSRQVAELHASLARAASLADSVQASMARGEAAAVYPLAWGPYQDHRQQLSAAIAGLQSTRQRTLPRLAQDLHVVAEIEAGLRALAAEVERAHKQRQEVLLFVQQLGLEPRPAWLDQAQTLHGAASCYAAGNWAEELAVAHLWDDALALERRRQRLLPAASSAGQDPHPLLPDALDDLAGQVVDLAAEIRAFQARLQAVAAAQHDLQQVERAAWQQLEHTGQMLDRLIQALHEARSPLTGRIARRRRALERLSRESRDLAQDLDRRDRGLVVDKVASLDRWSAACRRAVERLQPDLAADREQRLAGLRAQVDELASLGSFDLEQPMRQARQRLDPVRPQAATPQPVSQAMPDLEIMSAEAIRLLDERAGLLAAAGDLKARIGRPLQPALEAWDAARQEALRREEQMRRRQEGLRFAWPPLACDLAWAEDRLRQAQAADQRLPRHGRSVGAVRELLEAAARGYQEAAGEFKTLERQIDEQYRELQTLAGRLDRWQQQLATHRQAHGDDPAIVEAIATRLACIDAALAPLRRQWQQNPPAYRQVHGELQKLWSAFYGDVDLPGRRTSIRARDIDRA